VIDSLANDIIAACQYLEQHGGSATAPQLHGHERSAPKC
jgi:glutamate decarboxylase